MNLEIEYSINRSYFLRECARYARGYIEVLEANFPKSDGVIAKLLELFANAKYDRGDWYNGHPRFNAMFLHLDRAAVISTYRLGGNGAVYDYLHAEDERLNGNGPIST